MITIRKSLLQLLFSGSFMKRWNDKLRPMELVEMDKQGHKMIVAWLLLMLNSRDMDAESRLALAEEVAEGGLFDYLYRLVITDIKPPIFYQIKANPDDYGKLTTWVLRELTPVTAPLGEPFLNRMTDYMMDPDENTPARRILLAAHLYASYSEFKLLKGVNPPSEELQEIERHFEDWLARLSDIKGVPELLDDENTVLGGFARTCGHLRFQKRWSQTPRVPESSVLGHMFLVAAYSWLFSMEVGACRCRRLNNFFTGLFHDLPELLTRDIISPVKQSSPEITDLIKRYEERELDRLVIRPLNDGGYGDIAARLAYFLGLEVGSEFHPAIIRDGKPHRVTTDELGCAYNRDEFDPKDGELLKMCDSLAAYIEAYTALKNGISSDQLHQALWRIRRRYQDSPVIAGIHVGALLADFD